MVPHFQHFGSASMLAVLVTICNSARIMKNKLSLLLSQVREKCLLTPMGVLLPCLCTLDPPFGPPPTWVEIRSLIRSFGTLDNFWKYPPLSAQKYSIIPPSTGACTMGDPSLLYWVKGSEGTNGSLWLPISPNGLIRLSTALYELLLTPSIGRLRL